MVVGGGGVEKGIAAWLRPVVCGSGRSLSSSLFKLI